MIPIPLIEFFENVALCNKYFFRLGLGLIVNEARTFNWALKRAEKAARKAGRKVSAYRDFLRENGISVFSEKSFQSLPVMTKDSYIRVYPIEKRCVNGSYLKRGVAIDESSGSTGIPYNWVRGCKERIRVHKTLARMIEWHLGARPRIAINAFSMGAWATGVNMGESLTHHSVVKSTGPDLEKILRTLEFFGPKPGYFICGYPPFLKLVCDSMIERGFPISQYELHALVGGEGMSEELRDYLLKYFKSCISGYGASDLEMGIAVETPESILIRKRLNNDRKVREAILEGDHRVPMVFQYNPLTHYIETNDKNELIITLNYSKVLSPRIRYKVGDEGKIFRRSELLVRLRQLGCEIKIDPKHTLPFPYLALFGRKDQTISVMGANIYPEDVERAIYADPVLAKGFASFAMSVQDDSDGTPHPCISIEWSASSVPPISLDEISKGLTKSLAEINSDFRNAQKEYASALNVEVQIHGFGEGPFKDRTNRIKNRYLAGTVK